MKVAEAVISMKNVVLIVILKALRTDVLNGFSTVSGCFFFFCLYTLILWGCLIMQPGNSNQV